VAEMHLSQDGDGTPGHILRYNGANGFDNFEINKEDGTTHLSINNSSGTVRIPGIISSSGKLYAKLAGGGVKQGTADRMVFWNSTTGELLQSGVLNIGGGILSSSGQIAFNISGSWQGQNFISASQTFLSTGQRSGNSVITGSLFLTGSSGHLTASGNISASGYLNAKLDPDTTSTFKTVMYDTTTGRLSTTGSYGGGGGSTFTAAGISGSLGTNAPLIRSLTAAGISGSWQSQPFANLSATGISGSLGSNAPLIRSLTAAGISGSWQSQPFANLSATGISGSLGSNAPLIRSLTAAGISGSWQSQPFANLSATGISGSLGSNAPLIRSLTAAGISGSLGTNAPLIRTLTAAGISGSRISWIKCNFN
jgi:hypothetical protein